MEKRTTNWEELVPTLCDQILYSFKLEELCFIFSINSFSGDPGLEINGRLRTILTSIQVHLETDERFCMGEMKRDLEYRPPKSDRTGQYLYYLLLEACYYLVFSSQFIFPFGHTVEKLLTDYPEFVSTLVVPPEGLPLLVQYRQCMYVCLLLLENPRKQQVHLVELSSRIVFGYSALVCRGGAKSDVMRRRELVYQRELASILHDHPPCFLRGFKSRLESNVSWHSIPQTSNLNEMIRQQTTKNGWGETKDKLNSLCRPKGEDDDALQLFIHFCASVATVSAIKLEEGDGGFRSRVST